MSVTMPELFLGYAIQSAPSSAQASRRRGKISATAAVSWANPSTMSKGPLPRLDSLAPSGGSRTTSLGFLTTSAF